MPQPDDTVRLTVDGSLTSVERVQAELASLWSSHEAIGPIDRMAVDLALVELVTNVIRYALTAAEATADIVIAVSPTDIRVDITDHGPAFLGNLRDVTMPGPSAESGRGLSVILALSDAFEYTRNPDGNYWSFTRRLTHAAAPL